eukprot:2988268-Amphidinium_carterae.1
MSNRGACSISRHQALAIARFPSNILDSRWFYWQPKQRAACNAVDGIQDEHPTELRPSKSQKPAVDTSAETAPLPPAGECHCTWAATSDSNPLCVRAVANVMCVLCGWPQLLVTKLAYVDDVVYALQMAPLQPTNELNNHECHLWAPKYSPAKFHL